VSEASLVAQAVGRDWLFRLNIAQWMKLQSALGGKGPARISEHFGSNDWTVENVREVIERGLEGGGMAPLDARAGAVEIIDSWPLKASYALACDIIGAGWEGMNDLLKKKAAIEQMVAAVSRTQTASGDSATLSEPDSLPASSRAKPGNSASGNISP